MKQTAEKVRAAVELHCRRGFPDAGMDTKTLEALAVAAGVTSCTIRRFIQGQRKQPNAKMVERLAALVKVA